MKKILPFLMFMASLAVNGQLVKNGGFEETFTDRWGNVLPKYWSANFWFMMIDSNTLDKPHSGLRGYVLLNTQEPYGYDTVVGNLNIKFSLGCMPLKFQGYVKYTPHGANERFLMKAVLYNREAGGEVDTVAVSLIEPENSNKIINWKKFQSGFDYRKHIRPDSAEVIIYASQRNNYTAFTSLVVDDIDFTDTVAALSIENIKRNFRFTLYPNPATASIVIETDNIKEEHFEIKVYDITGRCIKSNVALLNPNQPYEMQIGGIENGTYFIQVSNGAAIETHKVIILK